MKIELKNIKHFEKPDLVFLNELPKDETFKMFKAVP